MKTPFFSVIIPTYNRSAFIDRCIQSVLNQTFKSFELIIVDDGSTDNTRSLLEKYSLDSRVRVLSQKNTGVSSARNNGVEIANANWITFLDSDDVWMEHKLQTQYNYIQINPEYNLIHSNEIWIRDGHKVKQLGKHKKGGGDQFIRSLKLCLIGPSCVAIRKETFQNLSGFRADFPCCEDYDLWLKITVKEKVGFIEEELVIKYGGHDDQLSMTSIGMDYWRVKSLVYILENFSLSQVREKAVMEVLLKKIQRLLKVYRKHEKWSELGEISATYEKYRCL